MKTLRISFLIVIIMGLFAFQLASAEQKDVERYSASVRMEGSAKGNVPITIHIYGYTPDDEINKLMDLFKTGDQDAVVKDLLNYEMGKISPVGGTSTVINYARVVNSDKGKTIRLVAARQLGFYEWRSQSRSTDYPFGIVELTIANDGKITGKAIGAAKIIVSKDNAIEVKKYGSRAVSLISIRKEQ